VFIILKNIVASNTVQVLFEKAVQLRDARCHNIWLQGSCDAWAAHWL
jgi:hypothetical protein